MTRAIWVGVAVGVLLALSLGYAAGGQRGLAGSATTLAVAGLLANRAAVAPADQRRRRRYVSVEPYAKRSDFPSYREIESALVWAEASRRHYDHGVRPLLTRLLASALADRHRIDLARQPDTARELLGTDLWPLVDPARPVSFESTEPGPDTRTLAMLVTRLEAL